MASKVNTSSIQQRDFQSVLVQIESHIDTLEHNDTSLEESLSVFENGIKLTGYAQKVLATTEQKVQSLLEENGKPIEQAFSEENTQ